MNGGMWNKFYFPLQQTLENLLEGIFGYEANVTVDEFAVFEEENGRDIHDSVIIADILILIDINLTYQQLAVILLGQFIYDRRQHLTGTTPGCPAVYYEGFALGQQRLNVSICYFQYHNL